MLRRAVVSSFYVALAAFSAPFWHLNWTIAVIVEQSTRGTDPETHYLDQFYPGVPGAVRLLRDSGQRIYMLQRDQGPMLHQRLVEMLMPLRPKPYDPATLLSGDLVALDAGRDLEVPAEVVYERGLVRVLRVR